MTQKHNKINIVFTKLGTLTDIGTYSLFKSKSIESLHLIYILSGKWFFKINNLRYSVKPGDILIIPPGDSVSATKTAGSNKIFTVEMKNGFNLTKKTEWNDYYRISLASHRLSDSKNTIKIKLKKTAEYFEKSEYLKALGEFLHILSLCTQYSSASDNGYVKQIFDYIKARCREKITTADIAAKLNISESYCCMLFKRETGETIINYINTLKIELAKKHIIDNDIALRKIPEAVGYSTYEYFSRVFKKYENMTPSEYMYKYGSSSI